MYSLNCSTCSFAVYTSFRGYQPLIRRVLVLTSYMLAGDPIVKQEDQTFLSQQNLPGLCPRSRSGAWSPRAPCLAVAGIPSCSVVGNGAGAWIQAGTTLPSEFEVEGLAVAVGTTITDRPPHRSVRARLRIRLLPRDPTQRLAHLAIAANIADAHYMAWRTQREHDASPNSMSMGKGFSSGGERSPVFLSRPRAALRLDVGRIVEDLLVPLRRQWR